MQQIGLIFGLFLIFGCHQKTDTKVSNSFFDTLYFMDQGLYSECCDISGRKMVLKLPDTFVKKTEKSTFSGTLLKVNYNDLNANQITILYESAPIHDSTRMLESIIYLDAKMICTDSINPSNNEAFKYCSSDSLFYMQQKRFDKSGYITIALSGQKEGMLNAKKMLFAHLLSELQISPFSNFKPTDLELQNVDFEKFQELSQGYILGSFQTLRHDKKDAELFIPLDTSFMDNLYHCYDLDELLSVIINNKSIPKEISDRLKYISFIKKDVQKTSMQKHSNKRLIARYRVYDFEYEGFDTQPNFLDCIWVNPKISIKFNTSEPCHLWHSENAN